MALAAALAATLETPAEPMPTERAAPRRSDGAACVAGVAAQRPTPRTQDASVAVLDLFLRAIERRAFRHAELSCGHREDALDLVQDAMLVFVRRYRNRPEAEWPLLFWRVLDSRLVDLQRRRGVRWRWLSFFRHDPEADEDALERVADPAEPGPLARLGDREATAALDRALRALPLRQRQVFLLRVWDGLDVAQTAVALDISDGSVKTHLFRALRNLREKLEQHL
jgi:RNA polymerase sigma-70 factor (ECF subfamily)